MAEHVKLSRHRSQQGLCYPRRNDSRASTQCTPTPDTSQSSDTLIDEHFAPPLARRGAPIDALLLKEVNESRAPRDRSGGQLPARSTMQAEKSALYAPNSLPCRPDIHFKPSLPPIKTMLAVPLSSPPNTPRPYDVPDPHVAREPSYFASTFKPTAFYANKKPRTELSPRHSRMFNSRSSILSPGGSVPSIVGSSVDPLRHGPGLDAVYERTSHIWPEDHQPVARAYIDESSVRCEARASPASYFSRVQSPGLRRQSIYGDQRRASIDMRPSLEYRRDRTAEGVHHTRVKSRQSISNRPGGPSNSLLYLHEQTQGRYVTDRSQHCTIRPYLAGREHDAHTDMGSEGAAHKIRPDQRAAFVMSSHHDYQQGRTRKRSNLPKQSTEIMKRWFDLNMSNPYPSEEQKQVFSNATSISMTQVSNWFINHRRRCPELRDKRDRSRLGDLSD